MTHSPVQSAKFLAYAGDFLTIQELWVAVDCIVHHTPRIFASASQRTQEKITLLSVADPAYKIDNQRG